MFDYGEFYSDYDKRENKNLSVEVEPFLATHCNRESPPNGLAQIQRTGLLIKQTHGKYVKINNM